MSEGTVREASQPISDRLSRIETKTENIAGDIADIKNALRAVADNAFPRTEADARSREYDRRMLELTQAVAGRLETSTYQVAHDSVIQRVAALENAPQKQLGWIALIVSGLGCFVTFLGVLAALLTGIGAIIVTFVK
jgi:hypothetical protein